MADRRYPAAGGRRPARHHAYRGRRDRRGRVRHPYRRRGVRSLRRPGRGRRGAGGPALGCSRRGPRGGQEPVDRPCGQVRTGSAGGPAGAGGPERPGRVRRRRGSSLRGRDAALGAGADALGARTRTRRAPDRNRAARQRRPGLRLGPRRRARSAPRRRPPPPANRRGRRGVRPDPAGSAHRGHRADEQPARDRRPPRRLGVGDRRPPHELRPDRTHRGCAGHGGDRGVDGVRQRPSLLRLLRPLHAARDHAHQPGRPRGDTRRRPHVDPLRPVPRPAARLPVRGERLRGAGRLARERRR